MLPAASSSPHLIGEVPAEGACPAYKPCPTGARARVRVTPCRLTSPHQSCHRACAARNRLGPACQNSHWAGPTLLGLGPNSSPTLCAVFSVFCFRLNCRNTYKLLKYVENTIRLRKNMKLIFVESLRVYIGIRLDKIHFCAILPPVKLL
jgi:hypothetical protein